jgi:tetratricopeptide (TPR) repeat protein
VPRTLALVMLTLLACEPTREPPRASEPTRATTTIETPRHALAGCRVQSEPRCVLADDRVTRLRIWLDLPAGASLEVTHDGVPRPVVSQRKVEGGVLLELDVDTAVRTLRVDGVEPRWTSNLQLTIERERVPELVRSAALDVDAGAHTAARERLQAGLEQLEGRERLDALQLLRRLLPLDDPNTLARTEETAELALALGRTHELADAAMAAVHLHTNVHGQLDAAREWLTRVDPLVVGDDEARVWLDFQTGMVRSRSGDLGGALASLEAARRGAGRLAMHEEFLAAVELLGPALAELGRGDEALVLLREALQLSDTLDCPARARTLGNVAWGFLLLAEAGLEHDPPAPLLDRALALVDVEGACPEPETAAYARTNLALVALAEHEIDEALVWLDELEHADTPIYLEPWIDEIAGQAGLADGRWSLVPAEVAQPEPDSSEPGLRFSALVRHGRTLERWGLDRAALDSYAAAEQVLDETLTSIGVERGRELFLAGRSASATGLVELLLAGGRVDEALCRARIARSRALRTIDRDAHSLVLDEAGRARRAVLQRDHLALRDDIARDRAEDWRYAAAEREQRDSRRAEQLRDAEALLDDALLGWVGAPLDCSSLAQPGAGEVWLVQFPSERGGDWLFALDAHGVEVAAMPAGPQGAELALAELAPRIRGATQLRVIPTGVGWALPFHALRFDAGVLLDVAPLVWGLDLGQRRARLAPEHARALVVADPSEDLPHAREEAERVAARLGAQGFAVERLEGAAATREALVTRLGEVERFHYAGHGTHGGASGWQAALLLHEGAELEVTDILTLPAVPSAVILSGCDTATVAIDTLEGGMNLGRAFVLAGADWVLAAEGKVEDALALELGETLAGVEGGSRAAATSLRALQLRLRASDSVDSRAWAAFRVVVP